MVGPNQIRIMWELLEALNSNNWKKFSQHMAPDTVYNEVGTQRRIKGIGHIIAALHSWNKAMPDARGSMGNIIAGHNFVTVEVIWKVTHTGTVITATGMIPAPGKSHTTPSGRILRFEDNKVKESRHYFDMIIFLTQIGARLK